MSDLRETILVRLYDVARATSGVNHVYRNRAVPERHTPAIQILDGVEEGNDEDPGPRGGRRGNNAPRRVTMRPEIYILRGATPETIGTALNQTRAAFIKAVLTDAELNAYDVRYEGSLPAFNPARDMQGELRVLFAITYILKADDL